jgi:hypothetical protein
MPTPNSKPKKDNKFQPPFTRAHSTLQKDAEIQEALPDRRLLVTLPAGEKVLRLGGQLKCLPCLIAKKGAVLPVLNFFLTVVCH